MRFNENVPIYIQISDDIKEQLISGKIAEGDKLLSVREFSTYYEVTALTIQRATQLLEAEGVIQSKKGVGSFIMEGSKERIKEDMLQPKVKEFIVRMKNMGIEKEEIISIINKEYDKE